MNVDGKVCVVTGGASGIGAALARRFTADGAEAVVTADLRDADELVDVTDPAAVQGLVDRTLERFGRIDLFCANAGIATSRPIDDDENWQRVLAVNTMSHVYCARAVLPSMLERGGGYLLQTASAAGLLTSPDDAAYAVSKHAAVAFAEYLAVTYGGRGIGVSVLCPMGVDTPLLMDGLHAGEPAAKAVAASGRIISPDAVADSVTEGLAAERFLILPHPEVGTFWAQKASDPDRWLAGIRRLITKG